MVDYVNVRNELTGAVGRVPVRLYNSPFFNKDDVWTLYDGDLEADCNCNGQAPSDDEDTIEMYEITDYSEEEVA